MRRRLLNNIKIGGGIILDQNLSDPSLMISGNVNNENIQWIRANSHRYLGYYMGDGKMAISRLDDSDSSKFADGSDADLTGSMGDVFMRLPRFFYHAEEISPDVWSIDFSKDYVDGYKEWDGKDLIGVYKACIYNGRLRSISGITPIVRISQADLRTYAQANGSGYSLVKFKHHSMMAFLFYALYGDTDSQSICGSGTYDFPKTTGQTDALGMTDTVAGGNGDSGSINFWGLENWWGDITELVDNVSINNRVWTITEDDGSTRNVQAGTSNGYISKVSVGESLDMVPTGADASESTAFCDYYFQSSNNALVLARSYGSSYTLGGVAYANAKNDASSSYTNISSRLAFRGELKEMSSTEYQDILSGRLTITLANTGSRASSDVINRMVYSDKAEEFLSSFMLVEQTGYSGGVMTVKELDRTNKRRYDGSMPTDNVFLLTRPYSIDRVNEGTSIRLDYHLYDMGGEFKRYPKLIGVYPIPYDVSDGVFSKSGVKNMVNRSQAELRSLLTPYGLDLVTNDAYDEIKELYMLRYTDTNIENTIGTGYSGSYLYPLGECDSFGMTDTVYTTMTRVNFLGLEGIFGDQPEFVRDNTFINGVYSDYGCYDKLGNPISEVRTDKVTVGLSGRVQYIDRWFMATAVNQSADRNVNFSSFQYYSQDGAYKLVGGNFNGPVTSTSYDCGLFYASFNNSVDTLYYKGGRAMFMGKIKLIKSDGSEELINFD